MQWIYLTQGTFTDTEMSLTVTSPLVKIKFREGG